MRRGSSHGPGGRPARASWTVLFVATAASGLLLGILASGTSGGGAGSSQEGDSFLAGRGSACRGASIEDFVKSNGGSVGPIRVAAGARGRGLFLKSRVPAGGRVLTVPLNLTLSSEYGRCCSSLREIFAAKGGDLEGPEGLALLLLSEAMDLSRSFWRPYLCTLPRDAAIPAVLSEDELTGFIQDAIERGAVWAREKERLAERVHGLRSLVRDSFLHTILPLETQFPHLISVQKYTPSRWAWAVSMVLSRGLIRKKGETKVPFMVPLIDMANHDVDSAEVLVTEEGVSLSATANGSEIAVSYGKTLCPMELLALYGIVRRGAAGHKQGRGVSCGDKPVLADPAFWPSWPQRMR